MVGDDERKEVRRGEVGVSLYILCLVCWWCCG